jgi:hypothetical protein
MQIRTDGTIKGTVRPDYRMECKCYMRIFQDKAFIALLLKTSDLALLLLEFPVLSRLNKYPNAHTMYCIYQMDYTEIAELFNLLKQLYN